MKGQRYACTILRRPLDAIFDVHGGADMMAAVLGGALLPFADRASSLAIAGDKTALRLGPQRTLIIAPIAEEIRLERKFAASDLAAVLVSDLYQGFDLDGPGHLEVIRQGAPLDLSPAAFPVGSATGTELWAIGTIVWRTTDLGLTILVERSFADYLEHWLLIATGLPSDLKPGVMRSPAATASALIEDPAFWAVAVPAVLIVGLAKGGFAGLVIIGMSILSLVVSPVRAAALMLPILILQDVVTLWAYRRDFNRRVLGVMVPGALLGTILATFTAARVSDDAVRLLVGLIATAFALNHLTGLARRLNATPTPPGPAAGYLWGTISGFTSFVAHSGGPPFQIWVLPQKLGRDALAGTTAWYFGIINLMKVPSYTWLGQLSAENVRTSLALAPLAILATFIGLWLVRRTPVDRFYRIIYLLMLVVGTKLLWDGATGLLAGGRP